MALGPRIWAAIEASSLVRAARTRYNTISPRAPKVRDKDDNVAPPFVNSFPRYFLIALSWIPVAIFFKDHVCEITTIRGPSMSPYFNERYNETSSRDVCLAVKLGAQENLRRGMIITFYNPLTPDALTTKRIVGLPEDIVHTKPPFPHGYIKVPPHHVWVEGDAEAKLTQDSNTYGPVSIRLIQGRITHILWPLRKAGKVKWWEHPDRLAAFRNPSNESGF